MNDRAKRSGSETRVRRPRVYSRVTDEERLEIKRDADAQGLSVGAYIRWLAIEHPQTRPLRRPVADVAMLAQMKGQVGRIGGNIHQLVKRANRGEFIDADELSQALREAREFLAAATDALKRA